MTSRVIERENADEIYAEIHLARQKYKKITSLHEAHSIIMEEFDEFWFDIKNKENLEMTRKHCAPDVKLNCPATENQGKCKKQILY